MEANNCYIVESPLGNIEITHSDTHVTALSFVDDMANKTPSEHPLVKQTQSQLLEYFEGKREKFQLPINPEGTEFQKKVWLLLLKIPFGKTLSYLKLSQMSGNVKAIRAIAAAVGKNPILILIPCHRIIGSNGQMIGYSGGIPRKKSLLELEQKNPQKSLF